MIHIADKRTDYQLLETGDRRKTERRGRYILKRPDPQCMWPYPENDKIRPDGTHIRYSDKQGNRVWNDKAPAKWTIGYKELKFSIKPTNFKHTGLFPEQAYNRDYLIEKINNERKAGRKEIKVLYLFAYTGGATVARAHAHAVCHVDAVKSQVLHAKENIGLSGLGNESVRYIVDDVVKFVKREINRNKKYDIIIMDSLS